MRCETTTSVKECALRARSTHGVHHAFVEVNIVIGIVLGEVLVAHVVPVVVDAVIGLALSLIAHVVIVVFVVAILHRIFLYGRYSLYNSFGRPTARSSRLATTDWHVLPAVLVTQFPRHFLHRCQRDPRTYLERNTTYSLIF